MSQDCAICSLPDDPDDALCLVMRNPVAAGREVCNTYGEVPNAALVHDYGFAVPGNPFDIVNLEGARAADIAVATFGARARRSLGARSVEVPELFEVAATDRAEEPCRPQLPAGLLRLLAACDPDHRPAGGLLGQRRSPDRQRGLHRPAPRGRAHLRDGHLTPGRRRAHLRRLYFAMQ